MSTAAQIIAEHLHDAGCRYVFGILGDEIKATQGRDTFTLICTIIGAKAYDGHT